MRRSGFRTMNLHRPSRVFGVENIFQSIVVDKKLFFGLEYEITNVTVSALA